MTMNRFRTTAAAVLAVGALTGAAAAATVSETFSFVHDIAGEYYTSLGIVGDQGSTVTVTAGTYPLFSYDYATSGAERVGQWTGNGLGVKSDSSDTNHRVDGSGANDILLFSFLYDVDITSITFGNYAAGSSFDLYGSDRPAYEDCCNAIVAGAMDVSGFDISGSVIGIGAWASGSAFKVRSLTVSYEDVPPIPLPAGAVLLLTGLAGLGAARRRKS